MRGLATVLVVTVVFIIFHFTLHWPWSQTFLVPKILLIFFAVLWIYNLVTKKRPPT